MTGPQVFRVALDMPLRRLFDYLAPEAGPSGAPAGIQPGMRVRVPFGRQRLVGVVMEIADSSDLPADRLKAILEVLDPQPILDPAALGLLRWAAEYYHHPIGEVISSAMPKALRLGASTSSKEERWSLTAPGHEAHQQGEPRRAPKQRKLLEFLAANEAAAADALTEHLPLCRDAAKQLVARGWIGSTEVEPTAPDVPTSAQVEGPPLS